MAVIIYVYVYVRLMVAAMPAWSEGQRPDEVRSAVVFPTAVAPEEGSWGKTSTWSTLRWSSGVGLERSSGSQHVGSVALPAAAAQAS
jgi:hypothetical protein